MRSRSILRAVRPADRAHVRQRLVLLRTLDQQYRHADQTTGTIQNIDFTLDAAGNIDAITDRVNTSLSQAFSQYALDRIDCDADGNDRRMPRDPLMTTYWNCTPCCSRPLLGNRSSVVYLLAYADDVRGADAVCELPQPNRRRHAEVEIVPCLQEYPGFVRVFASFLFC